MKRYKNIGYGMEEDPKGPWLQAAEVLAELEKLAEEIQFCANFENTAYEACRQLILELKKQ